MVMFVIIKRVLKWGIQNFKRQGNLSFATTSVLVITISLIAFLFLSHKILSFAIFEIRSRADISVYFRQDCSEEEVLEVQEKLAGFSEVEEVEYVSREKALQNFVERHKSEKSLMNSLQELGANPFLASLNIKAADTGSYEKVVNFLEGDNFSNLIEKVDFHRRRPIIERIFKITSFIDKAGIIISLVLILVSILVTYNTIRLTIYSQKEEIAISRLVGASNWFVRGPFLVQGAMCGILAFLVAFVIVGSSFYFLNSKISIFFPGFEVFSFFKSDFQTVFFLQLACALGLGIIPSFIAIRKYLEV